MAEDQYTRTLRARAFDNSRYLLPLATNTSLGQIVNARTLETQIARLLSSPYAEVRHLGALLKDAAREPSYNVQAESMRALVEEIKAVNPELGAKAEQQLLRPTRVAPTLVKYAEASAYESQTRTELEQAAAELMEGVPLEAAPLVDLVEDGAAGSGDGRDAAVFGLPSLLPAGHRAGAGAYGKAAQRNYRSGNATSWPA